MSRLNLWPAALAAALLSAAPAVAQVSVRVPFVQVESGPWGTSVRAPFVNVNVAKQPPAYFQPVAQFNQGPPVVSQSVPPLPVLPNQQSVPVLPDQSVPALPDQSVPALPGQPALVLPDQSVPALPGQSGPVFPDQSVPALPGQSGPVLPDQSVPSLPAETIPLPPPPGVDGQPQPGARFFPQQPGGFVAPRQPGAFVPPPQPGVVVPSVPSTIILPGPMTVDEFVRCFVPAPGRYEVDLIHPKRGQPVRVCFTLPPGHPRVRTGHCLIEFDYGRCQVEIRFRLFGRVTVDYDD